MMKFVSSVLLILVPLVSNSKRLPEYFGEYRTLKYNGLSNQYSTRFFMSSLTVEKTVKSKNLDGSYQNTFNLSFEVPILQDNGSIFLKFLFLEIPLDTATVRESQDGLEIVFSGAMLERIGSQANRKDEWTECHNHFWVQIVETDNPKVLDLIYSKVSFNGCGSSRHRLTIEKVNFIDPRTNKKSDFTEDDPF